MKCVVKIDFVASYLATVEGSFKDQSEIIEAARLKAEDADIGEFVIGDEIEAVIA